MTTTPGEWIEPPLTRGTLRSWDITHPLNHQHLTGHVIADQPSPPSADTLYETAFEAYNEPTSEDEVLTSGTAANPVLRTSLSMRSSSDHNDITDVETIDYFAGEAAAESRGNSGYLLFPEMAGPVIGDLPDGAVGYEIDDTNPPAFDSSSIEYVFTDSSSDGSVFPGEVVDANGVWDYTLQSDSDIVTINGPIARGVTLTGSIGATAIPGGFEPVADAFIPVGDHPFDVNDPGFSRYPESADTFNTRPYVVGAGQWELTAVINYYPRRYRFLYPTAVAVTRQFPRDDAYGLGSAPRLVPPPRSGRVVGGHT